MKWLYVRRMEKRRLPTPNFTPGRAGRRPLGVVLHTTAGSFGAAAAWFADPESRVSAHYIVGLDGEVAQLVDESDTAQHAGRVLDPSATLITGDEDPNLITIGIEFEDGGNPLEVERPNAQYRSGAALIAAASRRWGFPLDRAHVIGHREVFAAKACPGNLDVERMIAEATAALASLDAPAAAPAVRKGGVACLLPVRDEADELPGYLESVSELADVVIALDDGSGDGSADLLEASTLVGAVVRGGRTDPSEWNDGENRARLLRAADAFEPDWIVWLDADERLDPADARALRGFLLTDALPGCAFGLQLHRMWGERTVAEVSWVYRVFHHSPEHRLPDRRLHFNPIPVQIPRRAWVRTTIRVRHLDSPERLDVRRRKYARADPEGAFARGPLRLLDPPAPDDLTEWTERPANVPVLAPGRSVEGQASRRVEPAPNDRPELIALLPARNATSLLPEYLDGLRDVVDGVIALDDGSGDGTAEVLERDPLVERVLRNPRREGFAGWDDAGNRQQLLDAAAGLRPRWILWLDADERLDPDDAAALRAFVEREARAGCAYGLRVFRMVGDRSYDAAGLWAYRLFSWEPGQCLPGRRLHLVPIPESIPRSRWHRTTVRIMHLASLTEEGRVRRIEKYREADPLGEFQSSYEHLGRPGPSVRSWEPRPASLPVLVDPLETGAGLDLHELDLGAPVLSAIVISRNDERTIERSVRSVLDQECHVPFEVIVVVSGDDDTARIVRERCPEARLIVLDGRALPGRARNAGLAVARGDYVSFPGSHVELLSGSLAARVRAHEEGWPMVTGTIVNGSDTAAGWAAYFLDHARSLPGRPSGALAAAPAHCSYARDFLLAIGGFPEDMRAGEDTVVNNELFRRGHRAFRSQEIELVHRSPCTTTRKLISHHFVRGRALGRIVSERRADTGARGGLLAGYGPRYVARRLEAVRSGVAAWGGDLRPHYRRRRPLILVGVLAAWMGLWFELSRPIRRPAGRTPGTGPATS